MFWTKYSGYIIAAIALSVVIAALVLAFKTVAGLTTERDRYRRNTETLLSEVETYRTKDSLSAARVESLELTLKDYQRFRAEDAALIETLKKRNRDLSSVNKTQSETIIALSSAPKDTVIITKDSLVIPAVSVHCGDAWYDFDGLLTKELFTGTLRSRDSLVVAETVEYKRFLGFLWKTKTIKSRQVDVVNKNPHTEILGVEHITITH